MKGVIESLHAPLVINLGMTTQNDFFCTIGTPVLQSTGVLYTVNEFCSLQSLLVLLLCRVGIGTVLSSTGTSMDIVCINKFELIIKGCNRDQEITLRSSRHII